MLIVTKRRYKKQHVIGGSGIFDTVVNFFKRLLTSNPAKAVALSIAKQAGKHVADRILTPAPQAVPSPQLVPAPQSVPSVPVMTQKAKDDLTKLIASNDININNLMQGNGIAIQDLVRRLNGSGIRVC